MPKPSRPGARNKAPTLFSPQPVFWWGCHCLSAGGEQRQRSHEDAQHLSLLSIQEEAGLLPSHCSLRSRPAQSTSDSPGTGSLASESPHPYLPSTVWGSLLPLVSGKPAVKGSITQPIFNSLPLPFRSVFSLTRHLTPRPLAKTPSSFLNAALIYPGAMTWKERVHCLTPSPSA